MWSLEVDIGNLVFYAQSTITFEAEHHMFKFLLMLKCCFTSTENVGLLGTGAQDGHLDFHTAPEL